MASNSGRPTARGAPAAAQTTPTSFATLPGAESALRMNASRTVSADMSRRRATSPVLAV